MKKGKKPLRTERTSILRGGQRSVTEKALPGKRTSEVKGTAGFSSDPAVVAWRGPRKGADAATMNGAEPNSVMWRPDWSGMPNRCMGKSRILPATP